ncbi:hypothetical protein [Streptomyces sp. NPDC048516]|uniref:hypothetical protein n=1 Tax=Streptomyces sp. NPDC048516 TaxID=3365565 RepID=UPI003716E72E
MADNDAPAQFPQAAADALRAFNHATLSKRDGWEQPGDAYTTIGSLTELAARLPQAIGQTHRLVRDLEESGHLRSDKGTLDQDLAYAYDGLREARDLAERLGAALSRAHSGLGPIGHQD